MALAEIFYFFLSISTRFRSVGERYGSGTRGFFFLPKYRGFRGFIIWRGNILPTPNGKEATEESVFGVSARTRRLNRTRRRI